MLVRYSTLAVVMASMAIGAPLNINLGAYSPALVVGDGEISFAGNGAAAASGIVNTLQGAAASSGGAVAQGAAIAPAAGAGAAAPAAAPAAAQVQGLQRSALLSEPAGLPIPGVTRSLESRQIDEEVDDEVDEVEKRDEESSGLTKRQASGFDRALTFAEAALTKGPKVQLGTGEGGSGVGILVDNNQAAAARPGTGAAAEGAAVAAPAAAAPAAAA